MLAGPLRFVTAVRRRLAWQAGLRGAARAGAVMAGPALGCILAGWWWGWSVLGPLAAAAGAALTAGAAWLAWRAAPGLDDAAVAADRALGLPGLLTTATAAQVGVRPAGFAAAVGARADAAIAGRHAGQVVALTRTVLKEGGVALVALALVAGAAAVPTAEAKARAGAVDARLERAAALLELARSVEAGGDDALAGAIRRAGRSLAAPERDGAGVPDPGALAALERGIAQRQRRADDAREALERIAAGDLQSAAGLTAPGSAARTALEQAAEAPDGSAERAASVDAAVAELESQAAASSGAAGLLLREAAAHVRTARAAAGVTGAATAAPETPSADGSGGGDQGGGGRDTAPPAAPGATLTARLAAAAPRILARPVWDPADDPIVQRYFEVHDR